MIGWDEKKGTIFSSWFLCISSGLLPIFFYLPMMLRQSTRQYDYIVHLREAFKISQGGEAHGPHVLFHLLTAYIAKVTTFSIATSALSLLSVCVIVTTFLLYFFAKKTIKSKWLLIFFPVLSLLVQPFFILYFLDGSITRLLHTLEPFFGNVAVQHGIEGSVVEGTA